MRIDTPFLKGGGSVSGSLIITGSLNVSGTITASDIQAANTGANVSVDLTAPQNPDNGNLWLNTNSGYLYVYVNDGDSQQWIQPAVPISGLPTLSAVAISGNYTDLTNTPSIPTDLTDLGITDGTAGQVLTTNGVGGFTFEDTGSNSVGNFTFIASTIDTSDQSSIQFVPAILMTSDLILQTELVFSDGSRQSTAAFEGPQGPEGPPGPTGAGSGDVSSVGDGYVDNAVVRYSGTSGTSIQTSLASISDTGTLTAVAFSGSGASLTALNATNLSSGIIPDARFPSTLPATSGANLTALNANNLSSGTVPDARFPSTLPATSGANLTALNATNLASGTVPIDRLGVSGVRDTTTFLRGDNTFAVVTSGEGTTSNSFASVAVSGQNNVVAESATDTLTLIAGTGIAITTDAATDAITVTSTVSSGATAFTGLSDRSDLTVDRFYLSAITMLNTVSNGFSSYRFDQYGTVDNPTVYAISGTTIAFNLDATGHPFLVQTSAGTNYDVGLVHVTTSGTVTTGASAQGKTSGTLYWKIPSTTTGNYRYICQFHGNMVGTISIKDISNI